MDTIFATTNDIALIKIVGASALTPASIGDSDSVTAENIGFAIAINHAMAIVAQLRTVA